MSKNNALAQKTDMAQSAFTRFYKRLRREGHDVPQKQALTIADSDLTPVSRALKMEWEKAEAELLEEVVHPSQPEMDLDGGKTPPPAQNPPAGVVSAMDQSLQNSGETAEVVQGIVQVDAEAFQAFVDADASETLTQQKPKAKTLVDVPGFDDAKFAVVGVGADAVGVTRVFPLDVWGERPTIKDPTTITDGNYAGLVFKSGKETWVLGSKADRKTIMRKPDPAAVGDRLAAAADADESHG
jgi:hypothetical protein